MKWTMVIKSNVYFYLFGYLINFGQVSKQILFYCGFFQNFSVYKISTSFISFNPYIETSVSRVQTGPANAKIR